MIADFALVARETPHHNPPHHTPPHITPTTPPHHATPHNTNTTQEERKAWRKDHPAGFWARPETKPDGSNDLLKWKAGIPGKDGTDWEGAIFTLTIEFTEDFPAKPPICTFAPVLFHPNIFPSGKVCLSILNEAKAWKPSITLKQVLLGIQDLLDNPNNQDPAQSQANQLLRSDPAKYKEKIREQTRMFRQAASQVISVD